MNPLFIVVAYDIPDNKRRTSLHKTLKRFGEAVQYSVFECLLTEVKMEEMRHAVARVIDCDEDSVRYYRICDGCHGRLKLFGRAVTTSIRRAYIF